MEPQDKTPLEQTKDLSANKLPKVPEPVSVQFPRKPGANALRLISNSVSLFLASPKEIHPPLHAGS
jgi:hypothetical protein